MYTPRLTRPEKGNKYYIRKANGGYSKAIEGKCKSTGKPDKDCNTLANCVGYAYGRFHEIIGDTSMCWGSPVDARKFPSYFKKCEQGKEPKLGSIIVWDDGTYGHVGVVEQIDKKANTITVSQSGYNSNVFWVDTICKGDGNWRPSWMKTKYKFVCFIYNPAVPDMPEIDFKVGDQVVLKEGAKYSNGKCIPSWVFSAKLYARQIDECKGTVKISTLKTGAITGTVWIEDVDKYIEPQKPEGVFDLEFNLDKKKVSAWATNIADCNYIKLSELETLGIVKKVEWDSKKCIVNITTK